jgi:hypothetical protein
MQRRPTFSSQDTKNGEVRSIYNSLWRHCVLALTATLLSLSNAYRQLELEIYRTAPSFDAYMNMSTLVPRLKEAAIAIGERCQQSQGANATIVSITIVSMELFELHL